MEAVDASVFSSESLQKGGNETQNEPDGDAATVIVTVCLIVVWQHKGGEGDVCRSSDLQTAEKDGSSRLLKEVSRDCVRTW